MMGMSKFRVLVKGIVQYQDSYFAVERWYDVHVYYEDASLCDLTYSGDLQRYGTINTFLDALELTGDIYYRINGRNILIYKNE